MKKKDSIIVNKDTERWYVGLVVYTVKRTLPNLRQDEPSRKPKFVSFFQFFYLPFSIVFRKTYL